MVFREGYSIAILPVRPSLRARPDNTRQFHNQNDSRRTVEEQIQHIDWSDKRTGKKHFQLLPQVWFGSEGCQSHYSGDDDKQ
jgi:hypothetical protein